MPDTTQKGAASTRQAQPQKAAPALTLAAKIRDIQERLRSPKDQKSEEGWSYRTAEDIIRNLKPLLKEHGIMLWFQEHPVTVGGWNYITCILTVEDEDGNARSTQTCIREHPSEINRSASQITGSCISYAHKAVLADMFALDSSSDTDMEDPDRSRHVVHNEKGPAADVAPAPAYSDERPILREGTPEWPQEIARIQGSGDTIEQIQNRILRSYRITEKDFWKLLTSAGKKRAE